MQITDINFRRKMRSTLLLFALSLLGIFCLAKGSWPPACTINPCKNGAVCVPSSNGYNCRCVYPYTGRHCETVINVCLSNPCLAGGTCAVGSKNHSLWYCICPPGRTGLQCENVIHDCSSQPCQHGGSCCESQSGYTCDCKPGFTGNYCETDIDECLSEPCQNGGTCVDQVNGYSCTCRVGLTGRHCENKKPGCQSTTCLNGGSCAESSDGMWYCVCTKTFKGIQCEQRVNDCSNHPCQNGGSCCDKGDHYECTCPDGFTGKHCETRLIAPSSTLTVVSSSSGCSCQNGGICNSPTPTNPTPGCNCPFPYTGALCEISKYPCPCRNGGYCLSPTPTNPTPCKCPYPYTGNSCEELLCSCQNGGYCLSPTPTNPTPGCNCPFPYTGALCETHYCDLQDVCLNGGTCVKKPNSFKCICPMPYTGQHCYETMTTSPVSSSSENLCTVADICGPSASCTKVSGNHYSCLSTKLTTRFSTTYGITPLTSPTTTTTTSPTTTIPGHDWCRCENGGTCHPNYPYFYCSCPYPYTGKYCETHYCDIQEPCHNGGTCVKIPNAFKCICPMPFTGQQCYETMTTSPVSSSSASITPTPSSTSTPSSSSCDCVPNHGTCSAGYCSCYSLFYFGPRCEFEQNPCTRANACGSTEFCSKISAGQYTCISSPSITPTPSLTSTPSATLTISPTPALTSTPSTSSCHCQNGGTCLSNGQCYCRIGFGGPNCGYYTDYCLRNPCQNGGYCHEQREGYSCSCRPGFSGSICESGGTTSMTSTLSTIILPSTTSSQGHRHSSIEDHICDLVRPCHNGGTCIKTPNGHGPGYYCQCSAGFTGQQCDVSYGYGTTTTSYTPTTTIVSSTMERRTTITHTRSTFSTTSMTPVTTVQSSTPFISKRSRRDIKKNVDLSDVEDKELKRICKLNERKARKIFNDKGTAKKHWKNLHPGIKAVLIDLVANNDHRRLSSTHAQIKKAVAGNDLSGMSRIMSERGLWKRVPVARYWKRKQMMKKAVKNPWKSLVVSQVIC